MSSDDPPFPTLADLQHFNRITWLLGHEAFKRVHVREEPPTLQSVPDRRLPLLKSLASLLVRQHEVVAVMPHNNLKEIFITEEPINSTNPNNEYYISDELTVARNYRWDEDRLEEIHGDVSASEIHRGVSASENYHGVFICKRTIENNTSLDYRDAIPARFEDHVLAIITMLRRRAETQDVEKSASIKRSLHSYAIRASFYKIAMRAAFHCEPVAKAIKSQQRILVNFARHLPPPPSWEKEMQAAADKLGSIKHCYLAALKDFVTSVGTASNENDTWWSSDKTLQKHLSRLKTHVLDKQLKNYVKTTYDRELNEGFYLAAAGRRVYHETFTSLLASCLFHLQLLVKRDGESKRDRSGEFVAGPIIKDSALEIFIVTCRNYLIRLYKFLTTSPILPIHLEWYLASTMDEEGIYNEQYEGDEEGQEDEPSTNRATKFRSDSAMVKSIMRWLFLLTAHQRSIAFLTKNCFYDLFRGLRVHVIRTAMSEQNDKLDCEMQSLDQCLADFVPALLDRKALIQTLQHPPNYGKFQGAYHCEAILVSLYLLRNHHLRHPAVARELEDKADTLYPFLCGVSKKCCPVCTAIYSVIPSRVDIAITGTHHQFSPCRLPPWLPNEYAVKVTAKLEDYLRALIRKKVQQIQHNRDSSTGSSVAEHDDAEVDLDEETTEAL